jgi:hypothetical protein
VNTEPIRTVLVPIVLGCLAAAGQAFVDGADTRAIILAVVGVLVAVAQEYARAHVTPVDSPAGEADYVDRDTSQWRDDAAYSIVEVLLAVFLILVILFVLLRVVDDADAARSWGLAFARSWG